MKNLLIKLLLISQLLGFFFIYKQQYVIAIFCFSIHVISLGLLFLSLLLERLKDKKEEYKNDYRDY
jgi:hypothetical protein